MQFQRVKLDARSKLKNPKTKSKSLEFQINSVRINLIIKNQSQNRESGVLNPKSKVLNLQSKVEIQKCKVKKGKLKVKIPR